MRGEGAEAEVVQLFLFPPLLRLLLPLERLPYRRSLALPVPALLFVLRTTSRKAFVFPYGYVDGVRTTQR